MSFLSSFDISGYGLSAQRVRLGLISSNIANAQTTRTDEGGPYRRQTLILKAVDFEKKYNEEVSKNSNFMKYENPLNEKLGIESLYAKAPIKTVLVDKIVRDDNKPNLKYDPSHPDANAEGYVSYPNINPVVEMADMIEATRSYQANVSAFNSVKSMANSAIDMMKG
ncbi:MAG: flagellar basal-body rod protein FlgC [Pseudomonadota bacterium]|jgi:flagellar basal-body rod protein FlgC